MRSLCAEGMFNNTDLAVLRTDRLSYAHTFFISNLSGELSQRSTSTRE